jgi:hypothetical protein
MQSHIFAYPHSVRNWEYNRSIIENQVFMKLLLLTIFKWKSRDYGNSLVWWWSCCIVDVGCYDFRQKIRSLWARLLDNNNSIQRINLREKLWACGNSYYHLFWFRFTLRSYKKNAVWRNYLAKIYSTTYCVSIYKST